MYTTYNKGDHKVMHFRFESITDYVNYLKTAEQQPVFSVQTSMIENEVFSETESLDEALELLQFGDNKDFGRLTRLVSEIQDSLDMTFDVRRFFNDYVGFAPDVKAYLEGNPLSMINKYDRPDKRITIHINTSYAGDTPKDKIFNRGAAVIAAIDTLELLEFMVDLRLFEMSYCDTEVHLSEFVLKNPDERLNMRKLFFPLCHPSWVRRLNFRLMETTPGIHPMWVSNYGLPAEAKLIREILDLNEKDILIPTVDELPLKGEDILEDTRFIFDHLNKGMPRDTQLKLKPPRRQHQ